MQRFEAPWCLALKLVSWFVSCLLLGLGFFISTQVSESQPAVRVAVMAAPFAAMALAAVFMVRGYEVSGGQLRIQRLGWSTLFDLRKVTEARVDPPAVRRSLRLFGNGGFFSFSGWFRSKALGVYRFFGTDPERAVVLKFSDQRTIVVTPDRPEDFVQAVRSAGGERR